MPPVLPELRAPKVEDHFDPCVDVRHCISAFDDDCRSGDDREDAVLVEIGSQSRVRDCGILPRVNFAGAGKNVFGGGK